MTDTLIRDYREANRELAESFSRYMVTRGWSKYTSAQYRRDVDLLLETFGPMSAAQAQPFDVRMHIEKLLKRGLGPVTVKRHTDAFRAFYKFLLLAGIVAINPMLQIGYRKLPKRLPPVLTVEEVERVIAAARTPVERAVCEVLYSTGCRVSELCGIRLENIMSAERMILIVHGKGNKDRWVLYGRHAAQAITDYLKWRPSKAGFLFESPARNGRIYLANAYWMAQFYAKGGRQHKISLGKVADLPTEQDARARFDKIAAHLNVTRPGHDKEQGPYTTTAIHGILARLARIAGVKNVYPHAFRRAMACHMLANGADMRSIQELLGHSLLTTTQLYTFLTNEEVDKVYRKAHPHAEETGDTKDKTSTDKK